MDRSGKFPHPCINFANYSGGLFPPKTGQLDRMLWALNNIDALQREADERGMEANAWCMIRTETLMAELGPGQANEEESSAGDLVRDGEAVANGFAEAKANFRLSGLDPRTNALYQDLKSKRIAGMITAEEMTGIVMEHYSRSQPQNEERNAEAIARAFD